MHIIQAFADGKTIQAIDPFDDIWIDQSRLNFDALFKGSYRIKPEPKYRPFANTEECWQEMRKHEPFGWIKGKEDGFLYLIAAIPCKIGIRVDGFLLRLDSIKEDYTFADGTPFGIKVEE